jgi:hypothetical protein
MKQQHWLLAVAAVVLLAGAGLPARSFAAEPAGPATLLAAPAACAAAATPFAAQAPAFQPARMSSAAVTETCGCGDAICVGKRLNSICGTARLCQQISLCATIVAPVPLCECLSPP